MNLRRYRLITGGLFFAGVILALCGSSSVYSYVFEHSHVDNTSMFIDRSSLLFEFRLIAGSATFLGIWFGLFLRSFVNLQPREETLFVHMLQYRFISGGLAIIGLLIIVAVGPVPEYIFSPHLVDGIPYIPYRQANWGGWLIAVAATFVGVGVGLIIGSFLRLKRDRKAEHTVTT